MELRLKAIQNGLVRLVIATVLLLIGLFTLLISSNQPGLVIALIAIFPSICLVVTLKLLVRWVRYRGVEYVFNPEGIQIYRFNQLKQQIHWDELGEIRYKGLDRWVEDRDSGIFNHFEQYELSFKGKNSKAGAQLIRENLSTVVTLLQILQHFDSTVLKKLTCRSWIERDHYEEITECLVGNEHLSNSNLLKLIQSIETVEA